MPGREYDVKTNCKNNNNQISENNKVRMTENKLHSSIE